MATASTLEEQATCPICSGPYKEARKLPGCSHSFCEECILTYVLNLKRDAKLATSFQCPVCRLPSDVPGNGDITLEWIQSMNKTKATSSRLASDLYESCNQCSCLEKITKAKYYCVDCKESFCETCSKTFHSFKFVSNHVLIEVDCVKENKNVNEQALMMLEKFLTCSKHPRQLVAFYCESEKQVYCSECAVDNHQNCTKKKMGQLVDIHEETTSKTLVSSFKNLFNHIQSIIRMIREHDQENKPEPEKLLNKFYTLKQKVIQQLDILEESLKAESKAMCKDGMDGLKEFGQKLSVVTYLIDRLPAALSCVCIDEAGIISQHMKEETAEHGQSRDKTSIMLKTENMLKTSLDLGPNEISQIASVQRINKSILLPEYDDELCLTKCTVKKIKTEAVKAEYTRNLNPFYSGVLFLSDNKMILSDIRFGSICLTDENSKLLSSYRLSENEPSPYRRWSLKEHSQYRRRGFKESSPYRRLRLSLIFATEMTNNIIAVSVPDKKNISFLSANETLEYKGEIRCKYKPVAIHGLRNNDIAVLWGCPQAFGIITLTGGSYHEKVYFDKDKNQKKLDSYFFMAVDEARGHVIIPSDTDHTIYCYDFEGNTVFAYHDIEIESPGGVAIDGDGNIYVCNEKQGTIIVLSPAGILLRIIKDECPPRPFGIGFKEDGKTFAVTTKKLSSDVHFLSLTHS